MIRRYILAICACGLSWFSRAATDHLLESWQVDEGLPYTTVQRVLQDERGYLWLATMGGLVRFDGVHFREFTSPLIAGAASRNIRALALEDRKTLLMLPATGGIVRYRDGTFTPHPAGELLALHTLDALFVEPRGTLWLGLSSQGVARWDRGTLTQFGPSNQLHRGNARVSFATDTQGRTWMASGDYLGFFHDGELRRFTNLTATLFFVAPARSNGIWLVAGERLFRCDDARLGAPTPLPRTLTRGAIRTLFEDSAGTLWIGTGTQGLFSRDGREFVSVRTSQSAIASIEEDHEGNLWVATSGGGLNRLRPKNFRLYDARAGLVQDVSEAVCEDGRGDLWVANRHGGVARLRDGNVTMVALQQGRLPLNVSSVCADDRGHIWVGASSGLFRFPRDAPERVERAHPDLANIHVLFQSRAGDVWAGAEPNRLVRFRGDEFTEPGPREGFTGRNVRALAEDSRGGIWIGTSAGELFHFREGTCRRVTVAPHSAPIGHLYIDAHDTVWVGTAGGGLFVWREDRLSHIGREHGLPDDVISQIAEDDFARLWFGSQRGIFWIANDQLLDVVNGRATSVRAITLGKSEGLAGVYCLGTCQPMVWKARDGGLWFATQQGVLSLNPAAMKPNTHPPPVYLDELLVNDRPMPSEGRVQIPPRSAKLEFRFAALSYAAPEKVAVRHRVEGVDSDWVETKGQRSAVYGRLSPGDYRIRIIAANNDGVWNEIGATMAFTVLPAWWQTWWFYSAAFLAFSGALGASVRYWSQRRLRLKLERLERQQALERERARIARDLHDDLGASLTQIGLAAEMGRRDSLTPDEMKQHSAQVASRVRSLARELDAIVWTVNPRNDSLDKLASYLCQFSQEFFRHAPVRCRLDVAEDIPALPVTPEIRHDLYLVTKEAMNNVLKHSGATEVWLRLRMNDGAFEVTIEDNGRGFSPEAMSDSERNGLRNMRSRVEELHGRFTIRSAPGSGTTLELRLPLAGVANGTAHPSIER